MSLSDPRQIYGIHTVTPYDRKTGLFKGTMRVLKSSSLVITGTPVENKGGANKFPWAVEDGEMKSEISLKASEYPDFCFELFFGKAVTTNAAETSGNCSALVAGTGSLIGTTGIASVAVDNATKANLKLAHYVLKAVSATTFDVYASSDVDNNRGTPWAYQDDTLKITATPLTVTSAGTTVIPGTGVAITGGSGTIAMNVGDTASFSTRGINSKSTTVSIGGAANQVMPEFGLLMMAQKRGSDELTEVDAVRCKASGMPINFNQNQFSELDVKIMAFYDSVKDKVFDFRNVVA